MLECLFSARGTINNSVFALFANDFMHLLGNGLYTYLSD